MAATYDTSLPTDKDYVRLLIGDVNMDIPVLTDEEIIAGLAEETACGVTGRALKYLAAAHLLQAIHLQYMTKGRGVASKKISQLSLVFATGSGVNIDMAMQEKIKQLKIRGNELLTGVFEIL